MLARRWREWHVKRWRRPGDEQAEVATKPRVAAEVVQK
jgi:hypothetical protein